MGADNEGGLHITFFTKLIWRGFFFYKAKARFFIEVYGSIAVNT